MALDISLRDNGTGAFDISLTGATGITGDLSVTLGTATLSASSIVDIQGTSTPTLGVLTLSGAGTLGISGALNTTFDAVVLSGTALVEIQSTLSSVLGTAALSADGTVSANEIIGDLNVTLSALALSGSALIEIRSTLELILGSMTGPAAGAVEVSGTLGSILGVATISATGTHDFVIVGIAKDSGGNPLSGVIVWAFRESNLVLTDDDTSAGDGSYVLHVPDQDNYLVVGHYDGAEQLTGAIAHEAGA